MTTTGFYTVRFATRAEEWDARGPADWSRAAFTEWLYGPDVSEFALVVGDPMIDEEFVTVDTDWFHILGEVLSRLSDGLALKARPYRLDVINNVWRGEGSQRMAAYLRS